LGHDSAGYGMGGLGRSGGGAKATDDLSAKATQGVLMIRYKLAG